MNIETVGKTIDKIPVEISYKIIDLFSAGLYSSPNKAFEELVSNSYDAGATKVCVYVPSDKSLSDSIIWVADNGISMNKEGLKEFWKIGESSKRLNESLDRKPIGKFGIGKLATYVLTQKLTLICKSSDGKYYAVTMNYSNVNENSGETITLNERELTLDDVKIALNSLIRLGSNNLLSFDLWGDGAEETWTFAIMSGLKTKASEIQDGRLRWILSTALPLSSNFNLHFNGSILKSSKIKNELWKTWIIGQDDQTAEKFDEYELDKIGETPCIKLPNLNKVTGKFEIYKDSLVGGKSEALGRSHGIFLNIRNRLININDPLLGMQAISHGFFNRSRVEIHADELDKYITSTRESIKESAALIDLQKYIQRKFVEIQKWYRDIIEEEEKRNRASYKIATASSSLSRRPLLSAAKKYLTGKISDLVLTYIPSNLSEEEKEILVQELEKDLTSEKGLIQNVEWIALNPEDPIAKFDLVSRTANINFMHPFFANFIDEVKSTLPFQLIALTEILTETLLIEKGLNQDDVRNIIWERDSILRELTFSDKPNAPLVAALLNIAVNNASDLEERVTDAFNSLGFEAVKIGGNGKPDGKAAAILGPKDSAENYSITFDAKSTGKEKIKAKTASLSSIDRHKRDYNANYACVVAIDFEGATDDKSAVNKEAKNLGISLIRVKDLVNLVLLSSPKQINLIELRDFFESCHTVNETSEWIAKIRNKEVNPGPINELLKTVFELNKNDTEPVSLGVLRYANPILKTYTENELQDVIESLEKLTNYISIKNKIVSLQASPEKVLQQINQRVTNVPIDFRELYLQTFDT